MSYDGVDLFAGPGGWDTGAAILGLRMVGIEWDRDACLTARAAGHIRVQADIAELDPRRFANVGGGLIASPPCQAWSKAGKRRGLIDLPRIEQIVSGTYANVRAGVTDETALLDVSSDAEWADERSRLVLEPLRWTLALRPRWVALEQVPDVQPFWHRIAEILRALGYSVATGVLSAERFGVPQTRKRAILMASLDRIVTLPPATHRAFDPFDVSDDPPGLFDLDLLPWVSMADALGWGMTARPSITVLAGSGRQGGPDPLDGGSGARETLRRERSAGRWLYHRERSEAFLADNPRRDHPVEEPAPCITSKARSDKWTMCAAGRTSPETAGLRPRNPATEPSATLTGKGTAAWVEQRPATTVCGDSRVFQPGGHHTPGAQSQNSIRVSIEEAACLQSFPHGYPWQGSRTAQFRQVGDAVPPLLSVAVLGQLLGIDGWQDICRNAYLRQRAA